MDQSLHAYLLREQAFRKANELEVMPSVLDDYEETKSRIINSFSFL
jgi:predicted transcriptional regulator